jgi:hypothetical protein
VQAAHSVVLSAKVARLPAQCGRMQAKWLARADDRSGSFSDFELRPNEVRSSPDSEHAATASTCPFRAKMRHGRRYAPNFCTGQTVRIVGPKFWCRILECRSSRAFLSCANAPSRPRASDAGRPGRSRKPRSPRAAQSAHDAAAGTGERDRPDCCNPRAARPRIWQTSTSHGDLCACGRSPSAAV